MTRTRYKYMRDYKIDSDTEKKILDFCRTAKGEEQEDVLAACVEANKYIAHFQGYRRLAMKKLRDLRFKEEEESG